jgi:hypothetical protein
MNRRRQQYPVKPSEQPEHKQEEKPMITVANTLHVTR